MPDAKEGLLKAFTFTLTIARFRRPTPHPFWAQDSMERKAKRKKLIRISIRQLCGIFYGLLFENIQIHVH